MLKDYLLLVRLPNLFTVPSNILAGYFGAASFSPVSLSGLPLLIMSSVLLYISGIVFNDYFDVEIDRRERPFRPLPSEKVPKRTAFVAAAVSMIAANLLAFMVSTLSLIVVIILSVVILSYDYRLKQTIVGPIFMGTARTLNVLLGASPVLPAAVLLSNSLPLLRLIIVLISVFLYILSISFLSRMEIGPKRSSRSMVVIFVVIFAVITIIVIASIAKLFQLDLIISLSLFIGIIIIVSKRTIFEGSSANIQWAIKTLVLSIVVLDSIFISGTAGIYFGLPTLLLVVPSVFLARKLYVT